jgi:predicted membrane protein
MPTIDDEKEQITKALSEQYAQNSISLDEYERLIESVQKIGTARELRNIQTLAAEDGKQKHLSVFSWRSSTVKPIQGNAGTYMSVLGATRITINEHDLPRGKTVLTVHSILGLTEIHVPKSIKVINKTTPFLAGVFAPDETGENGMRDDTEAPELYILGRAILGNITIIRT